MRECIIALLSFPTKPDIEKTLKTINELLGKNFDVDELTEQIWNAFDNPPDRVEIWIAQGEESRVKFNTIYNGFVKLLVISPSIKAIEEVAYAFFEQRNRNQNHMSVISDIHIIKFKHRDPVAVMSIDFDATAETKDFVRREAVQLEGVIVFDGSGRTIISNSRWKV